MNVNITKIIKFAKVFLIILKTEMPIFSKLHIGDS